MCLPTPPIQAAHPAPSFRAVLGNGPPTATGPPACRAQLTYSCVDTKRWRGQTQRIVDLVKDLGSVQPGRAQPRLESIEVDRRQPNRGARAEQEGRHRQPTGPGFAAGVEARIVVSPDESSKFMLGQPALDSLAFGPGSVTGREQEPRRLLIQPTKEMGLSPAHLDRTERGLRVHPSTGGERIPLVGGSDTANCPVQDSGSVCTYRGPPRWRLGLLITPRRSTR
jgi:hypothetical protein